MHELCRLVTFARDNPNNAGELSDDDDDEVADQRPVADCLECLDNDNMEICGFASYMIDKSHGMGPTRVSFPPAGEEENEEPPDGEGRVEVHESILTVTDSLGKTPLHILCQHSVDVSFLRVILSSTRGHNQNPSAPTALDLITARDSRGATPLHYLAFSRQCPLEALGLMMDYCATVSNDVAETDPTLCVDDDGETPLHWALEGYMSPRRIQTLLRHSRASLSIKNAAGKTPFELFVGNFVDTEWKEHDVTTQETWGSIQAYLKVLDNQSHDEVDKDQWSPLHMLSSSAIDFPDVFYDIAIYFCNEHASRPDSRSRLPLHLACARTIKGGDAPAHNVIAHKLVAEYPRAASTKTTKSKRLPIHFAVETRQNLKLIAALLRAYPYSLNVKDPLTGLWPFLLAASRNEETIDTSYSLLRADPSIVQLAMSTPINKGGQRPGETLRQTNTKELEDHSRRRLRRLKIR